MSDFPGEALRAAIEAPIDHDPAADASPESRVEEVAHSLACAEPVFAKRGRTRIVLDVHRHQEVVAKRAGKGPVAKSGKVGRQHDDTRIGIDKARTANTSGRRRRRRGAGHFCQQHAQCLDNGISALGRLMVTPRGDVAIFINEGSTKIRPAKVSRHHYPPHHSHSTDSGM